MMTSRHWFFEVNDVVTSRDDEVAAWSWPNHAQYAIWGLNADRHLQVYTEYDTPVRTSAPTGLPRNYSSYTVDRTMSRDARRKQIVDFAADTGLLFEFGSWGKNMGGRPCANRNIGHVAQAGTGHQSEPQPDGVISAMQLQIEQLHQRIQELEVRPSSVLVNATVNNTVVINNFGEEDISFLDEETLKLRFKAMNAGILQTIRDVHMNDRRPHNCNVRVLSLKRNLTTHRMDDQWRPQPMSQTVDDLIINGYRINSSVFYNNDAFSKEVKADPMFECVTLPWMTDVISVRSMKNINKHHVIRTRQQVRSMLLSGSEDKESDPREALTFTASDSSYSS